MTGPDEGWTKRVESKLDDIDNRLRSIEIAVPQSFHVAEEVRSLRRSLYGAEGNNGLAGSVRDLRNESRLLKGFVLFFVAPVLTGVTVIVILKLGGLG